MKKRITTVLAFVTFMLLTTGVSFAVIVDFTGGTATLSNGTTGTTNNSNLWTDTVNFYVQNGIMIDFVGGSGTIGDYYSIGAGGNVGNDVIHAHWFGVSSIVFTKLDGTSFDLNYFDVTSNTVNGGGQATGSELSYITASNGSSMLLPSSDWGFDKDYYGFTGDGVARLWLDSNFDGITSFTVTSQNAYCFGLDNFYIDEPPPPGVSEPGTLMLLGSGLFGLVGYRRAKRMM